MDRVSSPPSNEGFARDLNEILEHSEDEIRAFAGTHFFITGGTGFVGKWFLESLALANRVLGVGIKAHILSRDPGAFAARFPHLSDSPGFTLVKGDIVGTFNVTGSFDAVFHAATPVNAELSSSEPGYVFDVALNGTRRALEIASRSGCVPFLFASSGAVYGKQPPDLPLVSEDYVGGPNQLDPLNAYHEGKRAGELLCAIASSRREADPKIARLFAFVGPYLPLDRHFAVGNFLADALAGRPISVSGDGTAVRSYLYASDMTSWLWAIFARGKKSCAYNVGSEDVIDIAHLARTVASAVKPPPAVQIGQEFAASGLPARYVPATKRIRHELGVVQCVPLNEAIARTVAFYRR